MSMLARIRGALDGFYAFVDQPLFLWCRPALALLLVPLAIAVVRPLWVVEMQSPLYPDARWLDVYLTHVTSGHDGGDLVEINALHQTIGMQTLDARTLGDLDWLPFGFGVLGLLVLRVAVVGNVRALVDAAVLVAYFCVFILARFAHTLRTMGHHLSADAPSRVAPFTPVMCGTQQVGDVTIHAGPGQGAYLVGAFALGVVAIAAWHLVEGRRKADRGASSS